ncbi:hypothetical protein BS47DRAFT_1368835 [Hydnum rufescens UP504]|uniref:Uncharacterized protein n=1 Tax=Hydnum rufescens UP504 TaxID=1448309 RepID=A0A9P6AEI1_9AGAM|nr:hypothetical protein BS47DRAFT_1368835 [Hydnum rufescens UP504]
MPRSLEQFWCMSQFLHELTQACCPENFSEGDHLCLKQLSLFLLLLAEFSRQALEAKSALCGKASIVEPGRSFNQGAQDESVGAECIQYAPKDHRFLIVLDPIGPPSCFSHCFQASALLHSPAAPHAGPSDSSASETIFNACLSHGKKARHAKPAELTSDSTARPTSNSTATHRSNRSKLKEEALPAEPTQSKAKQPYKRKPQKKGPGGGGDSEGVASSTVLGSPQTLAPKSRVRTYQKHSAQPQDIGKGPEKAAPPLLAPQKSQTGRMAHSDLARFDGIVLESPTWPPKSNASRGCPFPDINPMPTPTPTPALPLVPAPAPAATLISNLFPICPMLPNETLRPQMFPADQFEEPPDSEEEQRRLLGLPTASETEEFGPNAGHTAYSKNPGEALEDAEAPSSSDCVVPSFDDSSSEGEYMSGLEEAMNNERNPKDLARLEAKRAVRLEAQ